MSAGVFKTSPKRFRNPTAYSKTFKTVGFKRKKKPSKTKNTPTPKQKKSANKKSNPEPRKTAVNKEQHRSTPNPNVGSTSGARSSRHSSKIVTRSSISYHHPRKWRLRGHFSSSRVEQEVQVAAGGLYPLVVPCQIQPLASPQAV